MGILFDKQPLVLGILASIIDLNEAIMLQQIYYWLEINKEAGRGFHVGRYWSYNRYDKWNEQFLFLSKSIIKRVFKKLRNMELIIVDRLNLYQMDRTSGYTIDYNKLNYIVNVSNSSNRNNQNELVDDTQNETMDDINLNPTIPEITTEITTENISPSVYIEIQKQKNDRQTEENNINLSKDKKTILNKLNSISLK